MSADVLSFPRAATLAPAAGPSWSTVIAAVEADLIVYVVEDRAGRPWPAFEFASGVPKQASLTAAIVMRDTFGSDPAFRADVIARAKRTGTYRAAPPRPPFNAA